jgi:hypothetical protein
MSFLKRLLGGGDDAPAAEPVDPAEADAAERAYELDLARSEQARLDELQQRQLRYASYAWQPPAQGGERRADDADPERPAE